MVFSIGADEVPKGWYTVKELAEARHCSTATVYRAIEKLKQNKEVSMRNFKVVIGERVIPVPHFRLHGKKK